MCHTNKTLPDNRGMTLLEVMMAVAVFGIILVFVTQMTNTSSRIAADNSDQVRMMELARAEAERIKANPSDYELLDGINKTINYTPDGEKIEQTYAIKYQKEVINDSISGQMLKIIVGSVGDPASPNPLEEDNYENYVLVTWLPPIN